MRQITVLMIGLGRIGGKFYEQFVELDDSRVKILAVSEPNENNPLLVDCAKRGIVNYPDYEAAIVEFGSKIDIIMDTSNRVELKLAVRKLLQETGNQHTVLVPMVVDYLMWYLLPGSQAIAQSHHEDIGY